MLGCVDGGSLGRVGSAGFVIFTSRLVFFLCSAVVLVDFCGMIDYGGLAGRPTDWMAWTGIDRCVCVCVIFTNLDATNPT